MRYERLGLYSYQQDGRTVYGRRSVLSCGSASWPAIENWASDTKLIKGLYQCEMALWHGEHGQSWEAIRVLLTDAQFRIIYPERRRLELIEEFGPVVARGRIYCPHPANEPHQLKGCVTVGTIAIGNGVANSKVACGELWAELGGWEAGKLVELEVTN